MKKNFVRKPSRDNIMAIAKKLGVHTKFVRVRWKQHCEKVPDRLKYLVEDHPKRTDADWKELFPRYPMEPDGYAKGLEHNDPTIMEWLKIYGFVVVDKVFNEKECKDAIRRFFRCSTKFKCYRKTS
eukprot:UN02941